MPSFRLGTEPLGSVRRTYLQNDRRRVTKAYSGHSNLSTQPLTLIESSKRSDSRRRSSLNHQMHCASSTASSRCCSSARKTLSIGKTCRKRWCVCRATGNHRKRSRPSRWPGLKFWDASVRNSPANQSTFWIIKEWRSCSIAVKVGARSDPWRAQGHQGHSSVRQDTLWPWNQKEIKAGREDAWSACEINGWQDTERNQVQTRKSAAKAK